jgi:hypothetical protein
MKTTRMMCRLALGALLAVGCDRSDNTPKSPTPTPPSPDVTPKAEGGVSEGGTAGATAGQSGDPGSGASSPTVSPGTSEAAAAAPTTRPSGDDGASRAGDAKAAEQTKQAQELLDRAMAAMKDKRFEEARQSLDKVESMGGDVPKTIREQAATMRKSVDNLEKAPAEAVAPPPPPDEENK